MHELGDLLIKLRGGLSLREAAKRSGLSYSYISSLEKGKHPRTGAPINPTPEILRNLSKAYNHPYEELMKLAGYTDSIKEAVHIKETEEEKLRRIASDKIQKIKNIEDLNKAIDHLDYLESKNK